jgi:hypothetical protein
MNDISDLRGIYPINLAWSAVDNVLGRSVLDPATGERDIDPIALGSSAAKFAIDPATREYGYGLVRPGVYDFHLGPVGSPPPQDPGGEYKAAIACWLWNPLFDELRLQTNAALFLGAIRAVWDQYRTYKEAAEGLVPIVHFVDSYQRFVKAVGKNFWVPVGRIIGFGQRDKVPPFALREPTVKPWPPQALDSQVNFALLEGPSTGVRQRLAAKLGDDTAATPTESESAKPKRGAKRSEPPKRGSLNDFLDDEIPDLG